MKKEPWNGVVINVKKSFIELKKLKHTKETIIIPAHSKKTTVMK